MGFVLALGIALGYTVRPEAQGAAQAAAIPQNSFRVTSHQAGTMSLSLPGHQSAIEAGEINVYLTKELVYVKYLSGPSNTTIGQVAFRVPTQ